MYFYSPALFFLFFKNISPRPLGKDPLTGAPPAVLHKPHQQLNGYDAQRSFF